MARLVSSYVTRPAPGPSRAFEQLTGREIEVLQAMSRGLSNAEIAGELYMAETTVKTHVARVLAKLQVRDRVQAIVLAHRHGLVSD